MVEQIINMNGNTKPRCVSLFDESIKSKYTRKNYGAHLKQFRAFVGLSSNEDILTMGQDHMQTLLEDYLIHLKQTTNPNSIPSKFQGIKHFCVMNKIILDWEIIHRMFPQRQKTQDLRAYTTSEIRSMLDNTKKPRDRALVHFLASTGARIGAFDHDMNMGHTKRMSHSCIAIKIYAGYIEEYWAFLTPNATNALDSYHEHRKSVGEVFDDDTPIFTAEINPNAQLGWNGARSAVYRIVSGSGIKRAKFNGRYDVQIDHGFRKRFNTILKLDNSVNYNVVEKLMGHKNGLDGVYLTPTLDELFEEFKKAMHKIEI